jgi:anti-sigma regulatory factor (Ser/Thr protein kinase)
MLFSFGQPARGRCGIIQAWLQMIRAILQHCYLSVVAALQVGGRLYLTGRQRVSRHASLLKGSGRDRWKEMIRMWKHFERTLLASKLFWSRDGAAHQASSDEQTNVPEGFAGDAYICIRSQAKYASAVRGLLSAVCADTRLTDQDREDLKLAVGEAVCNAMRHGSPRGGDDYIRVAFAARSDGLTVTVSDGGGNLRLDQCKKRRVPLSEGGYGLLLIRRLTSRVQIQSTTCGTTVTMEKRYPALA